MDGQRSRLESAGQYLVRNAFVTVCGTVSRSTLCTATTTATTTAVISAKSIDSSYTMQHVVMSVAESGPAFEAGLRQGDLITHINSESIQG